MRKLLAVAVCVLVSGLAWAQLKPVPAGIKRFTNCAATGSSAQVLANNTYRMAVHDIRTTVCFGSVCDGGVGSDFPAGYVGEIRLNGPGDAGTPVACLSADGGGDVHFLPLAQ